MKTIAKLIYNGTYKVMYDERADINPYKVYEFHGNHRRLINEYADLGSAMLELTSVTFELLEG